MVTDRVSQASGALPGWVQVFHGTSRQRAEAIAKVCPRQLTRHDQIDGHGRGLTSVCWLSPGWARDLSQGQRAAPRYASASNFCVFLASDPAVAHAYTKPVTDQWHNTTTRTMLVRPGSGPGGGAPGSARLGSAHSSGGVGACCRTRIAGVPDALSCASLRYRDSGVHGRHHHGKQLRRCHMAPRAARGGGDGL
jgi:hypothetical protein